jgi:hypothetical protein
VAGKTPERAVRNFVNPIRRAVGAFIADAIVAADTFDPSEGEGTLALQPSPSQFKVKGRAPRLALALTMRYVITEDEDPARGPWKVNTTGWYYTIHEGGQQILGFHWHPSRRSRVQSPHLHAFATQRFKKRHVPTGRVLIEDVLELAIELGAIPLNDDWDRICARNRAAVRRSQSWGTAASL